MQEFPRQSLRVKEVLGSSVLSPIGPIPEMDLECPPITLSPHLDTGEGLLFSHMHYLLQIGLLLGRRDGALRYLGLG